MPMLNRGLFITLEGGEGAGKSTLLRELQKELQRQGHSILTTREPGGTLFGEQIRKWLLSEGEPLNPKAELLLFLAARTEHLEKVIIPALEQGKIVICDRFNDSTVAYQGHARGLGLDWVQRLCETVCGKPAPDLTLFLDVTPSIGLTRTRRATKDMARSGQLDRIESEAIAFHEKVREGLQEAAKRNPERICTIDANQTSYRVFQEANDLIKKKLTTCHY